jgi:hypothetical protein
MFDDRRPLHRPSHFKERSQLMSHTTQPTATMPFGSTTNGDGDGIFGWYQYIQDFTGDFALKWIASLSQEGDTLWEPFAGSGTSLVAAKMLGVKSIGYDMNPFMVDVARVKLDWTLDPRHLASAIESFIVRLRSSNDGEPEVPVKGKWSDYDEDEAGRQAPYPDDSKLRKWISPLVLIRLQNAIASINGVPPEFREFFRLAVASVVIPASNMSFRPNISYESSPTLDYPVASSVEGRLRQMLKDYEPLAGTTNTESTVHVGDARTSGPKEANFIFTSPPYPNDMEYVHQTRLELALLDYVANQRDLTVMKKQMISSSVKLVYRENEWQKAAGLEVPSIEAVYRKIDKTLQGKNWGWNAADMTAQFFGGMRSVMENWSQRLVPRGVAAVVIGDSAFNGVKVKTDELLADAAQLHGFEIEEIQVFRSRWNTKHDIELRESGDEES